jgi:hypothetical protein
MGEIRGGMRYLEFDRCAPNVGEKFLILSAGKRILVKLIQEILKLAICDAS